MSEDKRILKTKHNLKQSLISLLQIYSFEEITVKQLCEKSNTSRVTFYSHYSDKHSLADDIIIDMLTIANNRYLSVQPNDISSGSFISSLCNLLDAILDIYYNQFKFFQHISPEKNPYLYTSFSRHLFDYIFYKLEHQSFQKILKYPLRMSSSFITFGLLGFISEYVTLEYSIEEIRSSSKQLLKDLIDQHVLTNI